MHHRKNSIRGRHTRGRECLGSRECQRAGVPGSIIGRTLSGGDTRGGESVWGSASVNERVFRAAPTPFPHRGEKGNRAGVPPLAPPTRTARGNERMLGGAASVNERGCVFPPRPLWERGQGERGQGGESRSGQPPSPCPFPPTTREKSKAIALIAWLLAHKFVCHIQINCRAIDIVARACIGTYLLRAYNPLVVPRRQHLPIHRYPFIPRPIESPL